VALVEIAAYDTQHLAEPTSVALRHGRATMAIEAAHLTRETHSRLASHEVFSGLPQYNLIDRVADFRMTAALVPRRYFQYMRLLNPDFFTFYVPRTNVSALLDLAAVRYFISSALDQPYRRVVWEPARGLYLNEEALPRARLVRGAVVVRGEEEARAWLSAFDVPGAHASHTVLADWAVVEAPSADGIPQAAGEPVAPVEIATDLPDEVELRLDAGRSPALLVLADTFYGGWRATVDGRPARIHPVDLLFRGVVVPPGAHAVRFEYRSLSLRLGLALSAAGVTAVAALLAAGAVRARHRGRRRLAPA